MSTHHAASTRPAAVCSRRCAAPPGYADRSTPVPAVAPLPMCRDMPGTHHPVEAAEEGFRQPSNADSVGSCDRDDPHGSHERSEPMRRVFRPLPLRKWLAYRFAQHLGQIPGHDARGETPGPHPPIRAVDHDSQASLPTIPRSDARDVRGPASFPTRS